MTQKTQRGLKITVALIVTLGMLWLVVSIPPARAGYYTGWFTGYAMGNRYGGAGVEIRQGHFANHYYGWCPNDPAAWWTWGTRIDTDSPITQSTQSGGSVYYSTFYLEDVGDPSLLYGKLLGGYLFWALGKPVLFRP
ncbi:MAG: hypothetical protein RML46_11505 [Anaerolineae bacterium]|nr:hypothetical protein [Anaerolineae bacterium]